MPGDFSDSESLRYCVDGNESNLEPHLLSAASYFNKTFTDTLMGIVERHNPLVLIVAKNIRDVCQSHGISETDPRVQNFVDRFHRSRLSMRMLIAHHVALSKTSSPSSTHIFGIVDTQTDPAEVASEASIDAATICEATYGVSPRVDIYLPPGMGESPKFVFVPNHLHHVLFEILKNAMRAVVEKGEGRFGVSGGELDPDDLEPIQIFITEENDGKSVLIRISDRGVGISAANMPLLFTYAYTTANPAKLEGTHGSEAGISPIAGYGYGLPLSRLYARYFNGDLTVTSKEGYGTDVYLTLHKSLEGIMEPYV
ncbi:hypothetical protein HDU76_008574 [Blyttiomyces sp. JEL0837]|nr:hypothetical protein HDU76_008574 [Blyttiomyces sp. JEL0837]